MECRNLILYVNIEDGQEDDEGEDVHEFRPIIAVTRIGRAPAIVLLCLMSFC